MTEMQNKILASGICALLLFPGGMMGQSPAQTPSTQAPSTPTPAQAPVFVPGAVPGGQGPSTGQAPISGIRIIVLEGKKINRLRDGTFSTPVVEVRDGNDRPVEGALVNFRLQGGPGAGAAFKDGSLEKIFTTNMQGQAAAEGYTPNNAVGKFNVRVGAKYLEEKAEIVIEQTNTIQTQAEADKAKSRRWVKWAIIGGAVAGGIVAAVILTGGSSNPTVIVNPGPPVFGGR